MPIITPQGATPTGAAGGDLTGTYPSPSVVASLFAPQLPNLVTPLLDNIIPSSVGPVASANDCKLARCLVPKTGTLHDVCVWVDTQSGNVSLAVYDTGDATPGVYTRLATSGAVACGAAPAYQTFDPAIAVTRGQQILLAFSCDNTTAKFGFGAISTAAQLLLPTGFIPTAGGALPKLAGRATTAHPAPATIAEAAFLTAASGALAIPFARVA